MGLDSGYSGGSSVVDSDIDIAAGDELVLDVILPSTDDDQAAKLQVCFVIQVEIGNLEKKTPNITFFASINELVLLRNQ